jgi:hypothetical protein
MMLTLIAWVGARPALGARYWDVSGFEALVYFKAIR